MTQKIVIGMSLCNDKCRSRALKIAVSVAGVESAAVVRGERDQVVVIGECVDSVELTRRLRKKMGHAALVSVGDVDQPPPDPPYYYIPNYHHYQVSEPTCSIL